MTHEQIFNLINKWIFMVPLADADNQLAFAQAAYGQFTRMTMGREDLFHSSYSELCSVMYAIINAWCSAALTFYLPFGDSRFQTCMFLLFDALNEGKKHVFLVPEGFEPSCRLSFSFPPDFIDFSKGVK